MKGILKIACLAFCFTVAMTFFSCSNGSDGGGALLGVIGGGGTTTTPETDNGGGTTGGTNPTTPTPTPAVTYVITFNANDGSPNPATVPQNFTGGIPQALTPVEELGFSKTGFSFAGWGTAPKSKQASYADGASYTATANTTLYALWSESPVFSVNIPVNPNGNVTASPATAAAGTEITLSNTPNEGYQFASYSLTDADGGTVSVANGKFTMPAKNVTVTATFNDISSMSYDINVGTFANGSVTASPTTATVGTCVTLTATPASGYGLSTLAVTDADGVSVALSGTGNTRKFTMPAKNMTVTATFAVLPPGYAITETIKLNGTEYALVTFGLWPQTIKAAGVTVDESMTEIHGDFTYCKGSDGQWYVKQFENAYKTDYKYSDMTNVMQASASSYKWFKVEPIKWYVLTVDYNGTGKKLLLADHILIAKRYDDDNNNYQNSEIRKWLNSNAVSAAASDCGDSKGFLKTAFTAAQIAQIADTSVVNNARSTNPDSSATAFNNGVNQYASATPTTDKIFLLSEQEATKSDYGFDVYTAYAGDGTHYGTARPRHVLDFAKASGASHNSTGWLGSWWLRSPSYHHIDSTHTVSEKGEANNSISVKSEYIGVVPALCVDY